MRPARTIPGRLAPAALALLPWACGASPATSRANVLLIVVDTLGAEHLGCYGRQDASTPNLDALAASGVRFEYALSTAPWTQPSVASMFTSRMPSRHGVRNLLDSLAPSEETLAEVLGAAGYSTHAVVSHFLINQEFGFDQGFSSFDTSGVAGHDGVTAGIVTDRAIDVLEGKGEAPFFLFVHYFDPHFRYNHHPAHDRTSGYPGPLVAGMPIWRLREMRGSFTPADVEFLVGLYHEEIAHTDVEIGRLLARLDALGLADETLVVFTADHGEEFMEHGWLGHTRTLYDDLIRVPLVFRIPGQQGERVVAEPVSTLDIAPTILDLVLGTGLGAAEGVPLSGVLRGGPEPERRALFSEISFDPVTGDEARVAEKRAFKTSIVYGPRKLVHDLVEEDWRLYDRNRDQHELEDLFEAEGAPDLMPRLESFEELYHAASTSAAGAASEEDLQRLQNLGYVH